MGTQLWEHHIICTQLGADKAYLVLNHCWIVLFQSISHGICLLLAYYLPFRQLQPFKRQCVCFPAEKSEIIQCINGSKIHCHICVLPIVILSPPTSIVSQDRPDVSIASDNSGCLPFCSLLHHHLSSLQTFGQAHGIISSQLEIDFTCKTGRREFPLWSNLVCLKPLMWQVLLNTPLTPLLVSILHCSGSQTSSWVTWLSKIESSTLFHLGSLQKGRQGKSDGPPSSETANPIYMWMVQPKQETGLKEGDANTWVMIFHHVPLILEFVHCPGRFTLTRSSQRTFSVSDQSGRSTRRSSSLSRWERIHNPMPVI